MLPAGIVVSTARSAMNDFWQGATWSSYDGYGGLSWKHPGGDWMDNSPVPVEQGTNTPFGLVYILDNNTPRWVELSVSSLVQPYVAGVYQNKGFILLSSASAGNRYYSHNYSGGAYAPELRVNGSACPLLCDGVIYSSSSSPDPNNTSINASSANARALLRFDLSGIASNTIVTNATIRLYCYEQWANQTLMVFRPNQDHYDARGIESVGGLATNYANDVGIESAPGVYYVQRFGELWHTNVAATKELYRVESSPELALAPLDGGSLQCRFRTGFCDNGVGWVFFNQPANSALYRWALGMPDQTNCYVRYYLWLAGDWNQNVDGGKMPGLTGSKNGGVGGGVRCVGTNGWSARGSFGLSHTQPGNPRSEAGCPNSIGNYFYHMDQASNYGEVNFWEINHNGYLATGRWYSIEQNVQMNSVDPITGIAQSNGVVRAWVDGKLAYERTNFRFSNRDASGFQHMIEDFFIPVWHGGTAPPTHDNTFYMDNVVMADRYIGPMKKVGTRAPVAIKDSAATIAGVAIPIRVLDNDYDPDTNAIRIVSVSQPVHGTASNRTTCVIYAPLPGWTGSTTFNYTINDILENGNATASVTVHVLAGGTTAIYEATSDTYIDSSSSGSYGNTATFTTGDVGWSTKRSAMIRFDLSDIVSNTIAKATLRVFVLNKWDNDYHKASVGVFRSARDWVESQATRINFRTGQAWTNANLGDWFDADGVAQGEKYYSYNDVVDGYPAATGWYEWDVTELVREWASGRYSNYGLVLRNLQNHGGGSDVWATRESTNAPSLKPQLEISGTPRLPGMLSSPGLLLRIASDLNGGADFSGRPFVAINTSLQRNGILVQYAP